MIHLKKEYIKQTKRKFNRELKLQICEEVETGLKTQAQVVREHSIRVSMSKTGSPWENGIAESFFKTLKTNEVYLNDYQNIWEAKDNLFRFLNDVYNSRRLHSSLGYIPPNEFEETILEKK